MICSGADTSTRLASSRITSRRAPISAPWLEAGAYTSAMATSEPLCTRGSTVGTSGALPTGSGATSRSPSVSVSPFNCQASTSRSMLPTRFSALARATRSR